MIDPRKMCLFVPFNCGAKKYDFYMRLAPLFGRIARHESELEELPSDVIPLIGGSPSLRYLFASWKYKKRDFIYWDRGYFRRIYEAWLPKSEESHGGYYRFNLNCCSMPRIRAMPSDRWDKLKTELTPWRDDPKGHIVVAPSLPEHDSFHGIEGWLDKAMKFLTEKFPDREIVNRFRNSEKPLDEELEGAMCLVTHGSNAANEAVVMGYPVVVLGDCAAKHVGRRHLTEIDDLVRPDRKMWAWSMAYNQYSEEEILNGTAFRLMDDGRT